MKKTNQLLAALIASTGILFGASAQAQSAAPIVIKFSHVVAAETPKGKAAEMFKKLAEERTGGRVKVEVYPNSVLYKDKEELEALQLGAVQMLAPSTAKFGPLGFREFDAFALPFIFDNYSDVHKVLQGPIGGALLKKLETRGLTGLAFWDSGFKQFTGNRSMHKPEDLKGMKIRIQSSKVIEEQMRSLGVLPQVMAFSELYTALQTGVIDGDEQSTPNIWTQKFYEVEKHMTVSNHGYTGYAVVTNKKFWDELPADIRTQLDGAIKDATVFANDVARKDNEAALEMIKNSGRMEVFTPTPQERSEWKRTMVKVHATMAPRVGQEFLESIYRETGFEVAKK
ncbi:MAG: TRAP transporter substrate-binding protein [Azoarcus sp.]|nr:TRAP transporter substrate-binding protein [Azoarcus sp.]